jgi:hypothetical protein
MVRSPSWSLIRIDDPSLTVSLSGTEFLRAKFHTAFANEEYVLR